MRCITVRRGGCIYYLIADGSERPIAFASRYLATVEKHYSQLDKEALAIIFGVKQFHQYDYGRSFTIVSDHQPLMHLLSPSKANPVMAFARLQRWTLLLGAYDCKIAYKAGEDYSNADAQSPAIANQALSCSHAPRDNPSDGALVHGSSLSCPNLATDRSSSTPGQGEMLRTAQLA